MVRMIFPYVEKTRRKYRLRFLLITAFSCRLCRNMILFDFLFSPGLV